MDSMAQHGHPRVGSLEADQVQPYAPYGKACLNCAKSKTRCAVAPIGGKCERCHRLNKDCQPAPTVRKKRVSKRPASSTSVKTAELEAKVDSLVQMLERSQAGIPETSQSQSQIQNQSIDCGPPTCLALSSSGFSDPDQVSRSDRNVRGILGYGGFFAANNTSSVNGERFDETTQQNGLTSRSRVGHQGSIGGPVNGPPTPATSTIGNSAVPDKSNASTDYPLESEAELEEYLETYRTKMVPYFPIVCIGANVTVEELRKQRPFLFLVIRASCSKNWERQMALVLQVKKDLGREMLLEGTKNLDLFLGVLVFAAWCHMHICNKPIVTTVMQLAMSLAYDLGLTKPLPGEPERVMMNYTAQGCPKPVNVHANVSRTMEERRAIVGLYLVSSVSANYFQRIELMRWTRYLDECLRLLEEKKEYPTDALLVSLVRVQLICNKGGALTWNDLFGDAEMRIPADFYVKTLKSQLDDLERSIPGELKSNVTLQLHILNTTLSIHEHSLSTIPKSTSSDPTDKLQRIESLWICFTAVKSWFNIFFSLEAFPLSCYTHFSMTVLTQMAHCLVALFRLSTFESADIPWDRQRVTQEMHFGNVIKLVVDRCEQVPSVMGIEMAPRRVAEREDGLWPEGSWLPAMNKLLVVGNVWEAKIAAITAADAERGDGAGPQQSGAVNRFGVHGPQQMDALEFGGMDMDILDDTWIRDMLGGGYECNF